MPMLMVQLRVSAGVLGSLRVSAKWRCAEGIALTAVGSDGNVAACCARVSLKEEHGHLGYHPSEPSELISV